MDELAKLLSIKTERLTEREKKLKDREKQLKNWQADLEKRESLLKTNYVSLISAKKELGL